MSIENNELLLLDALVYYASLSDEGLNDAENITIGKFIDNLKKDRDNYETVFDEILGYTDKDLGMDDIIEFIDKRGELKDLVMVYPESSKLLSTSSVCLVDSESTTLDVYVIYVGNYADSPYKYESKEISTWVDNMLGAIQSDTDEQKRQLDFYNASIEAARRYFDNYTEDLNITVSGHSA